MKKPPHHPPPVDQAPAAEGPHLQAIRHHYEPRLQCMRESHEILDWASAASQRIRFAVLADNVELAGRRLLDVGCGLGDLWEYLQQRGIACRYTGVDILERMVQEARRRHPGGNFLHADVFAHECFPSEAFDVVFVSGAFNLNLGNNRQFLPGAIRQMFRLTSDHLVFNLLHRRAAVQEDTYHYTEPDEVREILRELPCQVRIIEDYLPNDFTTICRRVNA